MKIQGSKARLPQSPVAQCGGNPGFALIVTLSLMILLTVIAVGLLTLSSISLRSASQGSGMSVARANARLALMLALGDLQKYAGPDQRVTARADLLDEAIANPKLTGVWQSWDIQATSAPSVSDYDKAARDAKFLGWLTSSLDPQDTEAVDFASTPVNSSSNTSVRLWDKGTLGDNPPVTNLVSAVKVPTNDGKGAFAYAVMDEGVKVRINTAFDANAADTGAKTAQLGTGQRPNTSSITGLGDLTRDYFAEGSAQYTQIKKGITRQNFALAAKSLSTNVDDPLKSLAHDVTSLSQGIFTNTAQGGLKQDFSLMTNSNSLPSEYDKKGVYQTVLGVNPPSDPNWESLRQFAGLYKDATRLENSGGAPMLKAQGPSGWRSSAGANPNSGAPGTPIPTPPKGVVLMPSVVKVQMVFSLLVRDIYKYPGRDGVPMPPQTTAWEKSSANWVHGTWANSFAGSSYDYLLHLMYTPVVTLHNPYNVALEFRELKIMFGNVPFGLKVYRDGKPQTKNFAPLDTMYYQGAQNGQVDKRFGMTLKTRTSRETPGSTTFKLLPGEVMIFSPYIDPNLNWASQQGGNRSFADWDTGNLRSVQLDGIPGWRGDGIGFDLDWFCPTFAGPVSTNEVEGSLTMNRGGCLGATRFNNWYVEFAPLSVPSLSRNKYTVEIFARPLGSGQVSSGTIQLDYESATGLQNTLLGTNGKLRFPETGTINTMKMHSHSSTPIKNINTAQPFAIVSAQARATLGGQDPTGEDGKYATKPWAFAHANTGASVTKMVSDGQANGSHEIDFQVLKNGTSNLLQYDPFTFRGNFITGQTGTNGLKFGAMFDVPLAPIQTLAGLNGANPGGSSGYLPRFAQPIGNSWAHPMLNSSEFITSGSSYALADHSFLLNLALYDRFYFSGLADQNGVFNSTGKSTSELVKEFVDGEPLGDPRLELNIPDGKLKADLITEVNDPEAYTRIAAWQKMNGAFNVNSTSIPAWKAMLGSIHDPESLFNSVSGTSSSLEKMSPTDSSSNEARISRFRLPVSESAAKGGDPLEGYWLGAREYSDGDLELLATKIVEQVRQRGPFLSMADFVNRQLGNDEKAQTGALQQAIDETALNQSFANGVNAGFEIPSGMVSSYNYRNTQAGSGSSYQGAPGYLSQADLLNVLGNAATVRSDTFTIRGYGEARDGGKVVAIATCEAVVQRVPEYLDPSDTPEILPASLTSDTNRTFGRGFEIVSFRWLSPSEI